MSPTGILLGVLKSGFSSNFFVSVSMVLNAWLQLRFLFDVRPEFLPFLIKFLILLYSIKLFCCFLPLLLGEISADIKAGDIRDIDQISANGHVSFAGQHLEVDNLLAYLPTNLVISLLPLPIPVQADGRFKVQLDEVDYKAGCQKLTGKGQWLNANFTGTTGVIDLGNFDADLSCENNSIVVDIKQPNSFGLSATATIPADMKFKISGRFKPDPSLPQEVHQAAQFFGNPDAQGYYPIKF